MEKYKDIYNVWSSFSNAGIILSIQVISALFFEWCILKPDWKLVKIVYDPRKPIKLWYITFE